MRVKRAHVCTSLLVIGGAIVAKPLLEQSAPRSSAPPVTSSSSPSVEELSAEPIAPAISAAPATETIQQPERSAEESTAERQRLIYEKEIARLNDKIVQLQLSLSQTETLASQTGSQLSENEAKIQNRDIALRQLCNWLATDPDFPTSGYSPLCRPYDN